MKKNNSFSEGMKRQIELTYNECLRSYEQMMSTFSSDHRIKGDYEIVNFLNVGFKP